MNEYKPKYLEAAKNGILDQRISQAYRKIDKCTLCPRECLTDRLNGELGVCKTGLDALVSSHNAHFGEEPPLVGQNGSGTIFFTHCNLTCNFCQNYDISHQGYGHEVRDQELAGIMLSLQNMGCHNINFVTPTHVVPQILSALAVAVEKGLSVPLVYNSGGYDSIETLKMLDGIVDIYMPDFKFWDNQIAKTTCQVDYYADIARAVLREMHRQVGDLAMDTLGIAYRGLLVRHLVLPDRQAGTEAIMEFIANEISVDTYVNIMAQYRPCGPASSMKELGRMITRDEYREAIHFANKAGIKRLD